jgi:hypothetical protein
VVAGPGTCVRHDCDLHLSRLVEHAPSDCALGADRGSPADCPTHGDRVAGRRRLSKRSASCVRGTTGRRNCDDRLRRCLHFLSGGAPLGLGHHRSLHTDSRGNTDGTGTLRPIDLRAAPKRIPVVILSEASAPLAETEPRGAPSSRTRCGSLGTRRPFTEGSRETLANRRPPPPLTVPPEPQLNFSDCR